MSTIKISQLPAKGANLEATDLVEISEFNGSGYVSKSITGQEIIDGASGGSVTDVTATAPISSSGGSTPDISIPQASTIDDGYLSSIDFSTFNAKQDELISGVNIKTLNGGSLLGSGGLSVQPTLVSGTNIKTINSTSILGSGNIAISSGVTDVTATSPIVSTGGTTPDISIRQSSSVDDGYLSTGDWNAFNNKQDALVSGVSIKTLNGASLLGSGGLSVQDTLVSGTNIKTINGSSILGSGDLTISSGGFVGVHALMFLPSTSVTNQKLTGSPTLSGTLLTANTIIAAPFIPAQNITTSNLFINVTTLFAGALCRIAIYSDVNSSPSSRLYLSSDLNMSTIGVKTAVTTFNFVAGTTYWLAIHGGTTGTAAVNGIQVSDLIPIKGQSISGSFCMVTAASTFTTGTPATFPTPTFGFNNMPYIGVTKA